MPTHTASVASFLASRAPSKCTPPHLHTADEVRVEEDTDGEHDNDALAEHGVADEACPGTEACLDARGEETRAASKAHGVQGDQGPEADESPPLMLCGGSGPRDVVIFAKIIVMFITKFKP
jgi:hypothetical protein